jgi:hypothetical protein
MSSKRGLRSGVYVLLQTNGTPIEVKLGPSWYLESQQLSIAPDDWIMVEGTRSHRPGAEEFMAYQVTRGEQTLILRNKDGIPLWRSGSTHKTVDPTLPLQAE